MFTGKKIAAKTDTTRYIYVYIYIYVFICIIYNIHSDRGPGGPPAEGLPPWGPGGSGGEGAGKPQKTIQSPDKLYKAPKRLYKAAKY